jgi:N-acyl-D-amino-acid deacylase
VTTPRKKITRRAALTGLAGLGGLTAVQNGDYPGAKTAEAAPPPPAERLAEAPIPIQGKAGPGLEPFDAAMIKIMERHGVPGAALAIAKNGKLVLAKGYGWANASTGDAVQPDTLFGLASLSKPITAVATLKLVEEGKLRLEDGVFEILKHIKPPRGARVDPRLGNVTVRHCLNHSGGWDRAVTGDCINWEPQICRAYHVRSPLSPRQFITFALGLPLQFNPGTDAKYSNIGYIILGEVVAKVSGQSYEQFVTENVLKPMGMNRVHLHARNGKYLLGEALRHLSGTFIPLPAMKLPMVDAAGGWSASVVDMARFLTNLDGSRGKPVLNEKMRKLMLEPPPRPLKPRPNGAYFGLGWDAVLVNDKGFAYFKDGSYQGMRTYVKRLATGLNWALLYNASMEFDPQDTQVVSNTVHEVRELVEKMNKYPNIDLFKEFP